MRSHSAWRRRLGLAGATVAGITLVASSIAFAAPDDDKCHDGHGNSDQSAHCTGDKGDHGGGGGGGGNNDPNPLDAIVETVTGLVPSPPGETPDPQTVVDTVTSLAPTPPPV